MLHSKTTVQELSNFLARSPWKIYDFMLPELIWEIQFQILSKTF